MIEALDNKVPAHTQLEMFDVVRRLGEHLTLWFLRNGHVPLDITQEEARFRDVVDELVHRLPHHLTKTMQRNQQKRAKYWLKNKLNETQAGHFSLLPAVYTLQDVATTVLATGQKPAVVLDLHFRIGEKLHMDVLHAKARSVPSDNYWKRVASQAIIDNLYSFQKEATSQAIRLRNGKAQKSDASQMIHGWSAQKGPALEIYERMIHELEDQDIVDHAMLNVALGHLHGITG